MAKADFEVLLYEGVDTGPTKTYRPGDSIRGRVTLFTDSNVKCKHFFIRLGWHTEGRGSRYEEKIEELDVFQGELQGALPSTYDFSFVLPRQPWSYEGHYISVVWGIDFVVDVPWGTDLRHRQPFVLEPDRSGAEEEY